MTDKIFPTYDLDRGLAANRPATPTVSGGRLYCYVATDTHVISIWDGAQWSSFGGNLISSSFTPGSVIFAGTSGVLSQDNANLFWDNAAKKLGIGGFPAAATILDLQSTTAAFQPPRMTTTQRNAITAAAGMVIYNTTTAQHEGYKNAAWGWVSLEGRLSVFTVATLPAGPIQGDQALVTDALAPAFLVAIAGGGAVITPVYYNGANWVAG